MSFMNIKTIVLIYALTNGLLSLVMIGFWRENRRRFDGITLWLVAYLLQTLGLFLVLALGLVPDLLSVVAANIIVLLSTVLFYEGLCRFTGITMPWWPNVLIMAVVTPLIAYYGFVAPNLAARQCCTSAGIAIISVQCSWLLLLRVFPHDRALYRTGGLVFLLFAILYLTRALRILVDPPIGSLFRNDPFDEIVMIASLMLVILLTYNLFLMVNGRLFREIQGYAAEKERMVEELRRLANTDTLTQIYNRLKLEERLTAEVLRSQRYGRPLSIILLDVDHFKEVNDTHGHLVGDRVLQVLASLLTGAIRGSDALGRWGGEEFLVVCPETRIAGARRLAEKLRLAIADHRFDVVGTKTISLGIASLRKKEWEEDMLKRADDALYRAKRGGRNRVEVG